MIEVTLSVKDASHRHSLDEAVVDSTPHSKTLDVRSRTHDGCDNVRGLKFGCVTATGSISAADPDVHIALPEGSTIEVATASGDTDIIGNLAKATVTSASGGVSVADEVGVLEMKTASGDVTTATVRESSYLPQCLGQRAMRRRGNDNQDPHRVGNRSPVGRSPVRDLDANGLGQRRGHGRAGTGSRRRRDLDLRTTFVDDAPRWSAGQPRRTWCRSAPGRSPVTSKSARWPNFVERAERF